MEEPKHAKFTDLQLVLIEELNKKETKLATMYTGCLLVISQTGNPDRFAQAAHSLRELLEKLPRYFGVGEVKRIPLGVKFGELKEVFGKAIRKSKCWREGKWDGVLDKPLASFLTKMEELVKWHTDQDPTVREEASLLFRMMDARKLPLSPSLEKKKVDEWKNLYEFFQGVAHHRVPATEGEFRDRAEALQRILLTYLRPTTFYDFDDIDTLLEKNK